MGMLISLHVTQHLLTTTAVTGEREGVWGQYHIQIVSTNHVTIMGAKKKSICAHALCLRSLNHIILWT